MFCPNCSAETKDAEQKFCKICGTNLQVVADSLNRGQVSLETYKFDFDSLKSNLNDMGRNIRSAIQKGQKGDQVKISEKELELKKSLLMTSRTYNLQKGVIGVLSSTGMGIALHYFAKVAINAGTIKSIEAVSHLEGLEPIARILWMIAIIPFLVSIGYLINGIFLSRRNDSIVSAVTAPSQSTNPLSQPAPVTEHTTALLYDAGPKDV